MKDNNQIFVKLLASLVIHEIYALPLKMLSLASRFQFENSEARIE